MNTSSTKIILWSLVVVLFVLAVVYSFKLSRQIDVGSTPSVATDGITGCYISTLSKDVYTLSIDTENADAVTGTLSFDNFEKDSSHGTFTGTYMNGVLLGDYSFSSEGMDSVRQVIFKKIDNGFVEGFGDVKTEGDRESFVDPLKVTYDPQSTFVFSPDCTSGSSPSLTYVNANSDNIVITSPVPGATVSKNFSITGSARGPWYFEASFPIQVLDASGNVLYSAPVAAQGDWMVTTFVPFKADIKIPSTYSGPATVVLHKDNASGAPANDASVSFPITIR